MGKNRTCKIISNYAQLSVIALVERTFKLTVRLKCQKVFIIKKKQTTTTICKVIRHNIISMKLQRRIYILFCLSRGSFGRCNMHGKRRDS